MTFCPGQNARNITARLINVSDTPKIVVVSVNGLPSGVGGTVSGLTSTFGPVNPIPNVPLPAFGMTPISGQISPPVGLTPGGATAGYELLAVDTLTGFGFRCTGQMVNFEPWCPRLGGEAVQTGTVGQTVAVAGLTLNNAGSQTATLDYQWVVTDADGQPDGSVVSLNGLPPGTPATGAATLPGGSSTNLALSFTFAARAPGDAFAIELRADLDGDGDLESLGAIPIQNVPGRADLVLSLGYANGQVQVSWDATEGVLQYANSVDGPWTDVTGAVGFHSVPASDAKKFYRLRY